jgi:hypothetical protein
MTSAWMTGDEAAEVLGVSTGQVARLAKRGELTRSFDRPDAAGHPRYATGSVNHLARVRRRLVDPAQWLTRSQASAALGVSVRGFVKLCHQHRVRTNGAAATRYVRYSAEDVRKLTEARSAAPQRVMDEETAARELGGSTVLSSVLASGIDLGYNPRTRRYSAARVREVATTARSAGILHG